ncbi:TetR/AcrR family transcriptional regulator [Halopseudomonas pachastrellae]|nr:TetR/AcrR family transcriptional regulator [Halopseudomonas pachastrellae]
MTTKAPLPRIKDKRQAILSAALKVFAEGGVNGVPMPALAEQAQVGTGTIYRYFSSKEALVNELFREQRQFKRDLCSKGWITACRHTSSLLSSGNA